MQHPCKRALQPLAFLLFSLTLFPTLALSQPSAPALVRDINPGLNPEERTGEPQLFVEMGGIVYFYNYDPAHGEELWRTDGTEEGTWLLKDIVPGPAGSSPSPFVVGDTLYLGTFHDGVTSLWQSDGTTAGTVPVLPGYDGPLPPLDGDVAFSFRGCRETGPCELWKSEGMTAGTVKVATLTPPPGAFNVQPVAGSEGYPFFFKFSSQDARMHEIWTSDGTEVGTFPLRRFQAPGGFSTLFLFARSGGTLFFDGWDETWGRALWKSDGTVAGTVRIKDIDPSELKEIDGILYVSGRDDASGWELWRTDGTEAGTVLVKDIVPGPGSSFATLIGKVGGVPLVLTSAPQAGFELWTTDGSPEGTLYVKDIAPGADDFIDWMAIVDGLLFLMYDDGVHGIELWKSDGTAEGTVLVKDVVPGPGSFATIPGGGGAGKLYFWGHDRVHGHELWMSDGTEEGTFPLKDLVKATSSVPHQLTPGEDHLFFTATDGSQGYRLWKTDGTAEGTVPADGLTPPEPAPVNDQEVSAGGLVFFTRIDPSSFGYSLWRSDGTEAGTVPVASWSPGDVPRALAGVGGTLYFGLSLHAGGQELWKSDGTEAGTVRVRRVSDSSSPLAELTSVNGRLFFTAEDAAGRELWKSDGTEVGTLRVKDIFPGPLGSHPGSLAAAGDRLVFAATDPAHGREVWVSDGTPGGTFLVGDVAPGARSSWPEELTFWNGRVYFSADDGTTGIELWSFALQAPATANGLSVKGAGWFHLPPGKATFQLNADFKKGGATPEGKAKLKAPGVDFRALSFDQVVVQGPTAWLTGMGTVNGQVGYTFWIMVTDGQADGGGGTDRVRFRISELAGNRLVFDNEPGRPLTEPPATALGGGAVQIQRKGK